MSSHILGAGLVVLGAIGWGSLGLASTQLSQLGLSNLLITGLRIIGSIAVLIFCIPLFYKSLRNLKAKHIPQLVLQSLLGMLGMTLFYFGAVRSVGPAIAVALLYTAPMWSLILSYLFFKEQLSLKSISITLLAVVGVGLMMVGSTNLNMSGVLFGLASGLCYATYGVLGKEIIQCYEPNFLLFSSMMISAVAIIPFLNASEINIMLQGLNMEMLGAMFLLIVIGTLLPFALFTQGLKYLKASQAAIYTIFEPVTAVLLASFLIGIQLSNLQIIGIGLIVSVALFNIIFSMLEKSQKHQYS